MSGARRLEMNRHHPDLSLACQCALLGISRSSLYYQPTQAKVKDLELMTLMDRQYLKTPFYGSRRMSVWLRREGYLVNRKRVRRLMRVMGIEAIYRRPNTSRPSPENKVYPYLLRGLEVSGVNQVWMADITYIPMARGFLYLVAIMDWYSRYVLAWRLSNTLDADFCVDGLEEALRQGKPEIFNTDQGSQFTSEAFTSMLLEHGIRISMDGKGRYMDNIFVERLWRSVKYEEVYLKAYQNVPEARAGIGAYLRFYNHERPHQALGYQTPQEIFEEGQGWRCLHEQGLALPSNLETTSPVMVPTKPAEDSLNLALSLSKQWGPLHFLYLCRLHNGREDALHLGYIAGVVHGKGIARKDQGDGGLSGIKLLHQDIQGNSGLCVRLAEAFLEVGGHPRCKGNSQDKKNGPENYYGPAEPDNNFTELVKHVVIPVVASYYMGFRMSSAILTTAHPGVSSVESVAPPPSEASLWVLYFGRSIYLNDSRQGG